MLFGMLRRVDPKNHVGLLDGGPDLTMGSIEGKGNAPTCPMTYYVSCAQTAEMTKIFFEVGYGLGWA